MSIPAVNKKNKNAHTAQDITDRAVSYADLENMPPSQLRDIIPPKNGVYERVKRLCDLVVTTLLLIATFPLMVLAALAIKLTSRGPIFFSQQRAGYLGEPFKMYKFRSMKLGAQDDRHYLKHLNEQNGPVFKIFNDPRLTLVGKFLRKSSIDELPQLFNVLKGEMSLVGPRPLWVHEADQSEGKALFRTCVKPGITCLWQISGRSELTYEQWVELDLYYILTRSLILDMQIFIQTIPAVLTGRGAY